ncbi:P-loop containing nucleoside triphosphate hydrolase protein [Aspergillus tamarii]|uniref:P-loop containing nucleoside triphosphate hydrolase protein n=1 Tax=Aspergillus tamarii TaxID=41984 RepID=A0A5N6UIT4_ASPTM|nr:P-loop containing nucleoside triphosphate hydrolase protein [Aspergillus tamarii]
MIRGENRHHGHIKVLGLGLCRTGTDSLRDALRTLGYANPYHGYSCLENPSDCEHWYSALSAKYDGIGNPYGRKEFDRIMGQSQALCGDFPAACFGPELIKAYPEAKVILTYRDVDEWHQSVRRTVHCLVSSRLWAVAARIARALGLQSFWIQSTWHKIWEGFFEGDFETNGRRAFREHYELIKQLVPARHLLIFHVREGWEPLCEFLGQPVPSTPFPHVNGIQSYHLRCAFLLLYGNRVRTLILPCTAGLVLLVWVLCKWWDN